MQFGILFLFRIILDHFGLNFWVEQEVGRTSQIFWSFQISFPWTFLWYMTWPYLITPIFAYIQACTKFWGGEENNWNRSTLFLTYRNLISKGFLTAQDWNILNEDPFWSFLGPATIFLGGGGRHKVGGPCHFFFFFFFAISFPWAFPTMVYDNTILNEHPFLVILGYFWAQ